MTIYTIDEAIACLNECANETHYTVVDVIEAVNKLRKHDFNTESRVLVIGFEADTTKFDEAVKRFANGGYVKPPLFTISKDWFRGLTDEKRAQARYWFREHTGFSLDGDVVGKENISWNHETHDLTFQVFERANGQKVYDFAADNWWTKPVTKKTPKPPWVA